MRDFYSFVMHKRKTAIDQRCKNCVSISLLTPEEFPGCNVQLTPGYVSEGLGSEALKCLI